MSTSWEESCARVRAERDASIPKEWVLEKLPGDDVKDVMSVPYECGIMTDRELALTEMDATQLLGLMASGEAKSYDVTLAFCKRAAIAQQLLNCLTVMFVDEALERAKELDSHLEKTGKPVGPYHGLPFSIKDQWGVKGKESNAAVVCHIGRKSPADALVVRILREAGCVFYCKTTQPQAGMHLETVSNVYGRTLNPFNRKLTSGGSSGGEGALVAFRGSPIGLAADIGGSIRSPAANNGLFGAKMTSTRVPVDGVFSPVMGSFAIPLAVGPVCRSARDNEHFFKTVLAAEPWKLSHFVVPLPWRDVRLPDKLTIGILWDDGIVRPHPPILAALRNLKAKLENLPQVTVVDWEPYKHAWGYEVTRKLYFPDGAKSWAKVFEASGEPSLPLTQWVMKSPQTEDLSTPDLWKLNMQREDFRGQSMANWIAKGVDFVIAPVGPSAAPRHDTARYWGYTAVFNILDWPAYVFPTGEFVDAKLHPRDESYNPRDNEFDPYNWTNYEPAEYDGAPISFQLVGGRYDDERVAKVVASLSDLLGLKDSGSYKNQEHRNAQV